MLQYGLMFHHLGLAVTSPERALAFLGGLGYECGEAVHDKNQNVNLIMCRHVSAPDIEIVYPTETPGPLTNMLKSGREMMYHTCYETEDVAASIEQIESEVGRVLCVSPSKSACLFGGTPVSFYYVEGVGLIELLESGEKHEG